MDELTNEVANEAVNEVTNEEIKEMPPVPVRRQRRKRSKFQIFKEAYLPFVIVALAAILVITFVIGSIGRAVEKNKMEKEASIAASESIALEEAQLQAEANQILARPNSKEALGYLSWLK